jgi:hypothetical protein
VNFTIARLGALAAVLALSLGAAACGDDDTTDEAATDDTSATGESGDGGEAGDGATDDGEGAGAQNACPAEGCRIDFASVTKVGDEIEVTWDINFDPDINNNHIHIYWDNYSADQVSNDATDRGVDQGEWVPTDEKPAYVTGGAASTAVRGDSTTLCLVAADRDHNVLDSGAEVCRDVSDQL